MNIQPEVLIKQEIPYLQGYKNRIKICNGELLKSVRMQDKFTFTASCLLRVFKCAYLDKKYRLCILGSEQTTPES